MDKSSLPSDELPFSVPNLEEAIDYQPLIITPCTLVVDVIAVMSQTAGRSCYLANLASPSDSITQTGARSSCVLVMEEEKLLGIVTERDIVRLTATEANLAQIKISEVMIHPVITVQKANFKDVFAALFLFRRYRIRHLPIVDSQDQLVGVVSQESLRQILRPANLLKLRRVKEIMASEVVHAPLNASILRIAQLMALHKVSCVVIVENDGESNIRPVGILTERDIVQFQALQISLSEIEAQEVMSTPLFLLNPEDSLWSAHQEMQKRRVRRLVVSWNWGQGLGIVTQTSLLRVFDPMEMYGVIDTLQKTIEQLKAEKEQFLGKQNNREIQTLLPSHSPVVNSLDVSGSVNNQLQRNLELDSLLSKVQVCLESLVGDGNLSVEMQQAKVNWALEIIKQMRQSCSASGN